MKKETRALLAPHPPDEPIRACTRVVCVKMAKNKNKMPKVLTRVVSMANVVVAFWPRNSVDEREEILVAASGSRLQLLVHSKRRVFRDAYGDEGEEEAEQQKRERRRTRKVHGDTTKFRLSCFHRFRPRFFFNRHFEPLTFLHAD